MKTDQQLKYFLVIDDNTPEGRIIRALSRPKELIGKPDQWIEVDEATIELLAKVMSN